MMKKYCYTFCLSIFVLFNNFYIYSQDSNDKPLKNIIKESLKFSSEQYKRLLISIDTKQKIRQPKSINPDGSLRLVEDDEWTVGFFPGSLWYLFEYTKDKKFREEAIKFTSALKDLQYFKGHHDIGFMMNCSYGNALRLTGKKEYEKILINSAKSLSARFRPITGCIQSWESSIKWECPVIVDNMMNLEILFRAFQLCKDSSLYKIAVRHAETTIKNHYRNDNSSYHVVNFDTLTGAVKSKVTAQGYSDESAWARGQSWGLYGFTMCYRFTKRKDFLEQAIKIADFLLNHKNYPIDGVPYWDYNAPNIPNEFRDASAGAIMASALLELSNYPGADKKRYLAAAGKIIRTLASDKYTAKKSENGNFILLHSVGSIPHDREIDVPLNYADYYYIEALIRAKNIY